MVEAASQTERRVTYKALNSETVTAARQAASASGMSTEEWLTRAILENARVSPFEAQPDDLGAMQPRPGHAAPLAAAPAAPSAGHAPRSDPRPHGFHSAATRGPNRPLTPPETVPMEPVAPPRPDADERMEAMARHLRRAKAAADKSGMSVSEWLTQAIMESARAQHFSNRAANDSRAPEAASPVHADSADATALPAGTPAAVLPHRPTQPAMDPLQERLARIVAARRNETARDLRRTEHQPMLLATRPAKTGLRRLVPEMDAPRGGAPTISWFWTAVLVILIAIAGLIWSIPYLPESTPIGRANISPPMDRVAGNPVAPADRAERTPETPGPAPRATDPQASKPKPEEPGAQAPNAQVPNTEDPNSQSPDAGPASNPAKLPKAALAAVKRDAMPKPAEQNVEWYKRAADAGNHFAQYELAKLYIRGTGVDSDPKEAARLLGIAAREGDLPEAQYALGLMHERGIGVEKSVVEATLLYQRAADQGYVLALTQVGIAHLEGRGVGKDLEKAHRFLERAGEAGEMNAQYTLGRMYEQGLGVEKNRIIALKWFILAAQRGHQLATEKFEAVSHKISDEERERANELAREHNERFNVSPN